MGILKLPSFQFYFPCTRGLELQLGFFFPQLCSSDLKSEFSPCPCRESHGVDPEPVCSRALGELPLKDIKDILKWFLFGIRHCWEPGMLREHWSHRGCAVTALRGLQGLLPSCHHSHGHSLSCHLRKVWSCRSCISTSSALTHPKERSPPVCGGQEEGKKSAGQVCGQGVQEIWAQQWGQAEDRACLGLHTSSSEIPAFPKCQRKEEQQVLSRTPVLPWCTGIPQLRAWNIHLGAVAASGCHLSARTRSPGSRDRNAERGFVYEGGFHTMGDSICPFSSSYSMSKQASSPKLSRQKTQQALIFGIWGLFVGLGVGVFP